jgi:hypothetical protein
MEKNWDEVFMDKVRREEKERERKEKEGREKKVMKCLETEKDERFNTLLQLSFYVLKIKSKF